MLFVKMMNKALASLLSACIISSSLPAPALWSQVVAAVPPASFATGAVAGVAANAGTPGTAVGVGGASAPNLLTRTSPAVPTPRALPANPQVRPTAPAAAVTPNFAFEGLPASAVLGRRADGPPAAASRPTVSAALSGLAATSRTLFGSLLPGSAVARRERGNVSAGLLGRGLPDLGRLDDASAKQVSDAAFDNSPVRTPGAPTVPMLASPVQNPDSAAGAALSKPAPALSDKELLELREKVEADAYGLLQAQVGGDLGRPDLAAPVMATMRRLQAANGIDRDSVSLFLGGSFMPNAFTTITDAEVAYLKNKGRLRATFKNSNVFVSLGLIQAYLGRSDATLAFVLAHELAHNRLGHLKSLFGSLNMLGHLLEFDADVEALRMIARAGYDPREALDALELIEERVDGLAKEYPLLRRGTSEIHRLLSRWRDIHPNHALRRAKMEEHLAEALEIYQSSPMKGRAGDALGRIARSLQETPARNTFARFDEKANAVISDARRSFYEKIVALEGLIAQRIREKEETLNTGSKRKVRYVRLEDQLIVENAFRALSGQAKNLEDLNGLHQMYRRLQGAYGMANFPSHKAESFIVERQVRKVRKLIGEQASPARLDEYAGKVSGQALRALLLIQLKQTASPELWATALEHLGNHAQTFGVVPGAMDTRFARSLAKTLLVKTMRFAVDTRLPEDERAALAIEHLLSRLPATLITTAPLGAVPPPSQYLSTHLKAEILDMFFTGRLPRGSRWGVAGLSLLVEGRTREQALSLLSQKQAFRNIHSLGVMAVFNDRYYTQLSADLSQSGNILFQYERSRHDGITLAEPKDLLDTLFLYPYNADQAPEGGSFSQVPVSMPEAVADSILEKDLAWQQGFWEQATAHFLEVYIQRKRFADSAALREEGLRTFGLLQASLIRRSQGLAPLSTMLEGVSRALLRIQGGAEGAQDPEAVSKVADQVITAVVNVHVHRQLDAARSSAAGIDPAELRDLNAKILELDRRFSTFNTTSRLKTLASVFSHTVRSGKDYTGLVAYVHYVMKWQVAGKGGGGSGGGRWAGFFAKENRRSFAAAGLSDQHPKIPENISETLTSGALGLMADPAATAEQLLGASLAAFYKASIRDFASGAEPVNQTLAFLLLEEAARRLRSPEDARAAADFLDKVHDLDPLYLSYVFRPEINTDSRLTSPGISNMVRGELLGALAARKQPFRERDARSVRGLLEAIRKHGGWPEKTPERLKLLDWAGRTGDHDPWVEERILEIARQDPDGSRDWAAKDEAWMKRVQRGEQRNRIARTELETYFSRALERALGIPEKTVQLPVLKPAWMRIIRNPVKRSELYHAMTLEPFSERASHRYLREWRALGGLLGAYLEARRFFSTDFLRSVIREANPDARVVMVLEQASDAADAAANDAQDRWDSGRGARYDREAFLSYMPRRPWWKRWFTSDQDAAAQVKWAGSSASEREKTKKKYRDWTFQAALKALWDLGERYSGFVDPELGRILDNFPEPGRVRDDLLERLARARALTPERMSLIESYKSYRYPNPLRFAEKQLMEAAGVQLGKLSPAERVNLILHMGGVRVLPDAELKRLEGRILGRDRRAFAHKEINIYSFTQLLRYLDQLHPDDKELFVKSLFYGKQSISSEPGQVQRLFESVVIEGRGLPPLVQTILRHYFSLLTPSERVETIAQLIKASSSSAALDGPQVVKLALKGFGITGAKIGQVLATHKGLLPPEYAAALESFKDEAQSLAKGRLLAMLEQKMALLRPAAAGSASNEGARRAQLEKAAEFLYPDLNQRRREKYIQEILALERITGDGGLVTDIKELGRELGSGSIKLVYKVHLKDGSVWVAKIRRPGATVKVEREFAILDGLTRKLTEDRTFTLPNLPQLMKEVETLVRSELDFSDEVAKGERTESNVAARSPLEDLIKKGGRVLIPRAHPVYQDEDILLEEFVPSVPFKALPARSLWRTTRRDLARAIIDEAAQELILDGYIDPDRHSGNVLKRTGLRLRPAKLVWIDLGQSVAVPFASLKPLLRAGLALRYGKTAPAAEALSAIFELGPDQSRGALAALLAGSLGPGNPDVMERVLDAIVKAEGGGYLVRKDYAALQKAMLLLNGYSGHLPRNYFMRALERAVQLRILRAEPASLPRLAWYRLSEAILGADHYPAFLAAIERLQ